MLKDIALNFIGDCLQSNGNKIEVAMIFMPPSQSKLYMNRKLLLEHQKLGVPIKLSFGYSCGRGANVKVVKTDWTISPGECKVFDVKLYIDNFGLFKMRISILGWVNPKL